MRHKRERLRILSICASTIDCNSNFSRHHKAKSDGCLSAAGGNQSELYRSVRANITLLVAPMMTVRTANRGIQTQQRPNRSIGISGWTIQGLVGLEETLDDYAVDTDQTQSMTQAFRKSARWKLNSPNQDRFIGHKRYPLLLLHSLVREGKPRNQGWKSASALGGGGDNIWLYYFFGPTAARGSRNGGNSQSFQP